MLSSTIFFVISLSTSVSGQILIVKDGPYGRPVENVSIFNSDTSIAVLTNKEGEAILDDFGPTEPITIQHPSYNRLYSNKSDLATNGYVVSLSRAYSMLSEVTINQKTARMQIPTMNLAARNPIPVERIEAPTQVSTADLVVELPGVFVQRSQYGGGSPNIRGFEANRVLLVVDGIRMNNAIFRSGHLQNILAVDQPFIELIDVQIGPNSLLYGSDALGGVIHMKTHDPLPGTTFNRETFQTSFGTATKARQFAYTSKISREKFASFTGISVTQTGQVVSGQNRYHGYEDWSLLPVYVNPLNSFDTNLIANTTPHVQYGTGYDQIGLIQKLRFAKNNTLYGINLQYSTTGVVPRYDRLNDITDSIPKFAVWNYGPQSRFFLGLEALSSLPEEAYFDRSKHNIGFQAFKESRITRKFMSLSEERRTERVKAIEYNAQLEKDLNPVLTWTLGGQSWYNFVSSNAELLLYSWEGIPQSTEATSSRYPDGGSNYLTLATYSTLEWAFPNQHKLNMGLRYNHQFLNSRYATDFFNLPYETLSTQFGALTGSISYLIPQGEFIEHSAMISSGFHAPNLDDLSKVFEKAGVVTVPNADLRPEYVINSEYRIGLKNSNSALTADLALFYSRVFSTIVTDRTQLNGRDSVEYDGETLPVETNVNSGQANLYGFNFWTNLRFYRGLSLRATVSKTIGKEVDGTPLSHIPPLFGNLTLKYTRDTWTGAFRIEHHADKPLEAYGQGSTDNPEEATQNGTPKWTTINLRLEKSFNSEFRLGLAVENIMDVHYKPFASGVAAPGRNFVLSARGTF